MPLDAKFYLDVAADYTAIREQLMQEIVRTVATDPRSPELPLLRLRAQHALDNADWCRTEASYLNTIAAGPAANFCSVCRRWDSKHHSHASE